jgi:hypothetical protein
MTKLAVILNSMHDELTVLEKQWLSAIFGPKTGEIIGE